MNALISLFVLWQDLPSQKIFVYLCGWVGFAKIEINCLA